MGRIEAPMGALKKHKLEGGQGGKRGHSGMDHCVTTEEIKDATRRARRRHDKVIVEDEKRDLENASRLAPKDARKAG
jgi:hypothetical protein